MLHELTGNMQRCWNEYDRKNPKYSEKDPFQGYFAHEILTWSGLGACTVLSGEWLERLSFNPRPATRCINRVRAENAAFLGIKCVGKCDYQ
jgi:hypothetical protein